MMKFLITLLIFVSLIKTEPSDDLIKEMREKIAQINLSFLEKNTPNESFVNQLGKLLSELKEKKIITDSISKVNEYKNKTDNLIKSFKAFERFYLSKPEVDTLKKVFRVVNNEFNTLFGNYFLDELKNSSKEKIIFFSTSMSCECTLEMCYRQESEIQKLQKENPGLFDYAVVDCFTNFDLQSKYEVGFIPMVLVMDERGKEVKRFIREEKLDELINYILNKK